MNQVEPEPPGLRSGSYDSVDPNRPRLVRGRFGSWETPEPCLPNPCLWGTLGMPGERVNSSPHNRCVREQPEGDWNERCSPLVGYYSIRDKRPSPPSLPIT
jgi:hypothetical protein